MFASHTTRTNQTWIIRLQPNLNRYIQWTLLTAGEDGKQSEWITSRNGHIYHSMTVSEWHKLESDGDPWQPTGWLRMTHNGNNYLCGSQSSAHESKTQSSLPRQTSISVCRASQTKQSSSDKRRTVVNNQRLYNRVNVLHCLRAEPRKLCCCAIHLRCVEMMRDSMSGDQATKWSGIECKMQRTKNWPLGNSKREIRSGGKTVA